VCTGYVLSFVVGYCKEECYCANCCECKLEKKIEKYFTLTLIMYKGCNLLYNATINRDIVYRIYKLP